MHVMQSWFSGYMPDHSSQFPWLNHGCKIKCLPLHSCKESSSKDITIGKVSLVPRKTYLRSFGQSFNFHLGTCSLWQQLYLTRWQLLVFQFPIARFQFLCRFQETMNVCNFRILIKLKSHELTKQVSNVWSWTIVSIKLTSYT